MFQLADNKGFRMTLDNGVVCSVMFGSKNYGDNREMDPNEVRENLSSNRAEIAFFNEDALGNRTHWRTQEVLKKMGRNYHNCDTVGWVNTNEVLRMMVVAAKLNSEPTFDL
jgi:hypothetical protein